MPFPTHSPAPHPARAIGSLTAALSLLLSSFPLGQTTAQTPPPTPGSNPALAALDTLRSQFQRQVLTQSQTLSDQYERALARHELERAQAGDYEEAARIKQRRDQIQALFQVEGLQLIDPLAIPLTATAVKGTGIVTNTDGSIAGWRSSSHFAEWTNVKINPGEYYLELDYLMFDAPIVTTSGVIRAEPTALFEFFEVSLLAGAADNRRSFEITLGRDSTAYKSLRIGPIPYTRSPLTLRLVASRSYPGNVMRMKNIRLVPATPLPQPTTAGAAPLPADPTQALAALRSEFASALTTAYAPLLSDYNAQLETLRRSHPEWKNWIEAEQRQITRQTSKKNSKTTPTALPRPLATLGGIAGAQDWPEVRYLPDPKNTGDRFQVQTEDQTLTIRLQWIRCAPPDDQATAPADPSAASEFSKHFNIASEDSALFGRAAKEFTAGYLEGKTFRLLTRSNPDPDGSYPALLFLPDVGLFQTVLIDQGLAAVTGKPANSGGTLERALLRSLIEREDEAKNRDPRPGAWALSRKPLAPPATNP